MFETMLPVSSLFNSIANMTSTSSANNGTMNALQTSDMLPSLLETFIPGYGIIRRVLLEIFGIDVSVFLPLLALFVALHAGGTYVFNYVRDSLEEYCTCAVDMNEWDPPYGAIMRWLNEKNRFRKARYLRVAGRWWDRITERPEQALAMSERLEIEQNLADNTSRTPIFNPEARKPTGFEPDEGKYYFWYRGRPFCLNLYFKELKNREVNFHKIRLSCFGFSTQPLKDLIKEAVELDVEEDQMTDFFRPYPQDSEWKRVNSRPSRPLDTVTLDTAQKTRIVRDVNDFIHPARKQWYASRGIPYRRGYLFSGPPGTGKTSLSLALAGVFNLSLYALSIQDPTMSDTRLTELFDDLPSQCVVLLEDIDGAGVVHSRASDEGPNDEANAASDNEKDSSSSSKRQPKSSKVTLAGLLNAIDGVASHEGHVLIMTTNYPEKLDSALKRPGRVDLHIEFTMATNFQAREIFLRLFTDGKPIIEQQPQSQPQSEPSNSPKPKTGTNLPTSPNGSATSLALVSKRPATVEEACRERWEHTDNQSCPFMPFQELQSLADNFANSLPGQILSPAEIQGYLLLHKADPRAAAQGAKRWATEAVRQKGDKMIKTVRPGQAERTKIDASTEVSHQPDEQETANGQSQTHIKASSRNYQRRKVQRPRAQLNDDGTLTPGPSDEDKNTATQHDDEESDETNQS